MSCANHDRLLRRVDAASGGMEVGDSIEDLSRLTRYRFFLACFLVFAPFLATFAFDFFAAFDAVDDLADFFLDRLAAG